MGLAIASLGSACAGTFGPPPPPPQAAETANPVIPPDFDELPLLDLQWSSPDPQIGTLRGLLPSGEVVAGRVVIPDVEQDARDGETGVTNPGFEEGADVFSPFPERWPPRTNNVIRAARSSRVDLAVGTETGRILECRLELSDADRGFLAGARGVCTDSDGTRFRTLVSSGS